MKWVSVNTSIGNEQFELWDEENKLADISFTKSKSFGRYVSKLSKRLFIFEKRGLFTPKTVIKNEYGIKMGKVEETKPGAGKGIVELNGVKYHFVYDENNTGELKLYDEQQQKNLLSCSFNTLALGVTKTKSLLDTKFPSLLMVLCWYAFQPNQATNGSNIALNY